MKIAILMPLHVPPTIEGEWRSRLCGEVWKFYSTYLPDWPITVGTKVTTEGEFNRAGSINDAAKTASNVYDPDVFVIADADIIPNVELMKAAIESVDLDTGLIVPYSQMHDLSCDDTEQFVNYTGEDKFAYLPFFTPVQSYLSFGGLSVVSRQAWEAVGGFEDRCVGWGCEDDIFRLTLDRLINHVRVIEGPAWHLWHPKTLREKGMDNGGYWRNRKVLREYETANIEGLMRMVRERKNRSRKEVR